MRHGCVSLYFEWHSIQRLALNTSRPLLIDVVGLLINPL